MEITRYEDGQTGRTILLDQLIRFKTDYYVNIDAYIHEIIDHKGILELYWITTPTEEIKKTIEECWEFLNECYVIHYILKKGEYVEL